MPLIDDIYVMINPSYEGEIIGIYTSLGRVRDAICQARKDKFIDERDDTDSLGYRVLCYRIGCDAPGQFELISSNFEIKA